jgi:hypothetical protein
MAVTVQRQVESAVTERYQDACGGSAIENGTTIILFDLRKQEAPWRGVCAGTGPSPQTGRSRQHGVAR